MDPLTFQRFPNELPNEPPNKVHVVSEGKNVEDIVPKLYEQPNYQNSHENYQKVPDMNE